MKKNKAKKRIYLDYAATTPIDKRVLSAMHQVASTAWGNASSLHFEGESAKDILEKARTEVAEILHCREEEIYFTAGGTEASNIAVLGVIAKVKTLGALPHVVCSSIEHSAVLEAVKASGAEITLISPDRHGIINPESVKREIKESTVLVCLMRANNEIGTIQPIREVSNVIKNYKKSIGRQSGYPYLFTDACQSVLYEQVSFERLGADIIILDGIKMYGPRGAGILAIKHGVEIAPTIFGGGQEKGLRSGTENVIAALGLAEALKVAAKMREGESKRLTTLRDYCIKKISKEIPDCSLNGHSKKRLPNNVNICFASSELNAKAGFGHTDSEFLVIKLDTLGFAVSAASACNNLKLENSSFVLEALGKKECASSSLRFTFGRETKKSDIDKLVLTLKKIC